MSVRATIARNTMFNILGRVFEGVFGMALMWFALQRLGAEGWGVWSLVAVFTGYAALFDLGIGSGFAKYVAEYDARGERHKISALITTGLLFYFLLSVAAIAVVWLVADTLIDRFLVPWAAESFLSLHTVEDIRFLCRGAVVLFGVNNCVAPFANVSVGLQRMGINNAIAIVAALVKFATAVTLIQMGWGVRGLFAAQALSVGLLGAGCIVAAFVLMPELRIAPHHVSRDMFQRLFSFGWRTQVAKLANLLDFQTDRLVVAAVHRFGDMGLVGLYGIGEYLATKMRQAPLLLVSALIPAASALDAQSQEERLDRLYLRATKYMAAVALPAAAYMIGSADLLLHAWLGAQEGLHHAGWVMRILCAGYLFNLLPSPGINIVLGKGLASTPMYAGLISMSVNVVASVSLFYAIGFYGIPMGTSIGMIATAAWFFLHVRKHLHVPLRTVLREALLWPAIACIPGGLACIGIDALLAGNTGHLPNLAGAIAAAAALGLSYLSALRFLPFLDHFDRTFLLHTLRLNKLPGASWAIGKGGE